MPPGCFIIEPPSNVGSEWLSCRLFQVRGRSGSDSGTIAQSSITTTSMRLSRASKLRKPSCSPCHRQIAGLAPSLRRHPVPISVLSDFLHSPGMTEVASEILHI